MKINQKLIISFLAISLISLISVSSIYVINSKIILKDIVGSNFEKIAQEKANSINNIMNDRVVEVELLAEMNEIKDIIKKSNSTYRGKNDEEITSEIKKIDENWIESKETNEYSNRILNNDISTFLREYRDKNPEKYGEVFVTNEKGVTIAMTKILSDYYQADEQWWIDGFNEGKGSVFIDDRGFDSSVGTLVVGVVVPVKEDNNVIGILKINYKIQEIIDIVGNPSGKTDFTALVRSHGNILASSREISVNEAKHIEQDVLTKEEVGYEEYSYEKGKTITGYATVATELFSRVPNKGERKGISGEKWKLAKWFVIIEMDQSEAMIAINRVTKIVTTTSIITLILVTLLAFFISRSLSDSIKKLIKSTEIIKQGNLKHRIHIKRTDEIGQLAEAFNKMTDNLEKSHKNLEKKVKDRTQELEDTLNDFYTMRISMQKDVKSGTVEKENIKIKKKLDDLKISDEKKNN